MTLDKIIHILRNPWGWEESEVREARNLAADLLDKIEELEADSDFLNRLRAAGVDNWEGYEFALEEEV